MNPPTAATQAQIHARLKDLIDIARKWHNGKRLKKSEKILLDRFTLLYTEQRTEKPGILRTQDEVAALFGVTARTIRDWQKRGMPKTQDGFYHPVDIERWRYRTFELKEKENVPREETKEFWETEYRKAKALLADIQLKIARGELLEKDKVEAGRVERILTVKQSLLSLPTHVAPALKGLDTREIKELLESRLHEVIRGFSGQGND